LGRAAAVGRRPAAPARLRQPALLARSRERAAHHRTDSRGAGGGAPRGPRRLRDQPRALPRPARRRACALAGAVGAVRRRPAGRRARHLAIFRAPLRSRHRGRRGGAARCAALPRASRPAHRAYGRGRRAGDRGRAGRVSGDRAPAGRRDGRPGRHPGALGRRRARCHGLPRALRPQRRAARARAGKGGGEPRRVAPPVMTLELLGWPLAAALVLAGIHAWLGLHVLARGVIFVDLALAQVAALGATVALLAGHGPQGGGASGWPARRPLAALSFGGTLRHARVWDFGFYLLFGLVVTSSVRVAGVLLVFTYLIVPAVAGALLAREASRRLVIGWSVGALGSVAGIAASFRWDLPTGATIVATLGAL